MCDFLSRLPRLERGYISHIPLLDWSPVPNRMIPFDIFQNLRTLKIASDLIAVPSFFDQLEPCVNLSSLFLDIDPSFFSIFQRAFPNVKRFGAKIYADTNEILDDAMQSFVSMYPELEALHLIISFSEHDVDDECLWKRLTPLSGIE